MSVVLLPLPPPALSVLAFLPILILLAGLAVPGWSAMRATFAALGLALLLAGSLYGLDPLSIPIPLVKAILLCAFILPIVWAAFFLHALLERLGAIDTIGVAIADSARWTPARALLIAWGFSGFIQGFAGAGAPVASTAPLLRMAGFGAIPSAAAAMVGHSWAITFGSMGSSYFAIQLVTRLPLEDLASWLGLLFVAPTVITGLAALHILLGWRGLREGGPLAVGAGLPMAGTLWLAAVLGAGAVASILAAMVGCSILLLAGRLLPGSPERGGIEPARGRDASLRLAIWPYLALVVLSLAVQAGPLAGLARSVSLGIDFPELTTALGHHVPAELNYPHLRVLQHPATLIAVAIALAAIAYRRAGRWPRGVLPAAVRMTYQRAKASSVIVLFMVMMALVMNDAGMVEALADGLRHLVGPAFPVVSPFLGVLGAFMTGSNTSSNVTMGALQIETAAALGLAPALIAAAQSVGGSIGAGVSPDKAVIGANAIGLPGQEAAIMRRALPYALLTVAVVGLELAVITRWQ